MILLHSCICWDQKMLLVRAWALHPSPGDAGLCHHGVSCSEFLRQNSYHRYSNCDVTCYHIADSFILLHSELFVCHVSSLVVQKIVIITDKWGAWTHNIGVFTDALIVGGLHFFLICTLGRLLSARKYLRSNVNFSKKEIFMQNQHCGNCRKAV